MNKNEVISAVSEKTNLSKSDAAGAVEAVLEVITEALAAGGDVRLVGFGTFSVGHRAATTGRNPLTGAKIEIKASNYPKFKPGKGFKDAVNS